MKSRMDFLPYSTNLIYRPDPSLTSIKICYNTVDTYYEPTNRRTIGTKQTRFSYTTPNFTNKQSTITQKENAYKTKNTDLSLVFRAIQAGD